MTSRPRSAVSFALAVAIPVLLVLGLSAWALASPVGSSPDDDFHLPSIWCGAGLREGLCEATDDPATRAVPTALTTANCFAFVSTVSGACWNPDDVVLTETVRVNTAPTYPPLFYATLSVFAGGDVQTSVLLMRLFNIVLVVGVLTALFWALPRRLRALSIVTAIAPAVPLGVFVIASTNPSAWGYLSASIVFPAVYATTRTRGRQQMVLAGFAVLGAVIGGGARADAAAFAVFAALLALLVGAEGLRRSPVPWVATAVIAVAGVGFYLSARQSDSAAAGLPGLTERLTVGQHVANFLNVPALWTGALGGWGLGWLDTTLPAIVVTFCTIVVSGAVFLGLRGMDVRRGVALGLAALALWLVPFVLLVQSNALVGEQVQPRYILPLVLVLVAVASSGPGLEAAWRGLPMAAAVSLLAVANAVSMNFDIRRYTTGTDAPGSYDPGRDAEWWWPAAPRPLWVWVGGSLAFGVGLALLWWVAQRSAARSRPVVTDGGDRPPTGPRSVGDATPVGTDHEQSRRPVLVERSTPDGALS